MEKMGYACRSSIGKSEEKRGYLENSDVGNTVLKLLLRK
jgi:hypothetical protein